MYQYYGATTPCNFSLLISNKYLTVSSFRHQRKTKIAFNLCYVHLSKTVEMLSFYLKTDGGIHTELSGVLLFIVVIISDLY